ncbi:MAG: SCO6880 family protein [Solirubrobacteraceae bacterium]
MGETSYRFAPHPSSGLLLGLRLAQLLGFILAGALALGALHLGGLGGLTLALGALALAAGILLVPVRGQTIEQWTPLVVRFLFARFGGRARFRSQRAQLGHVVALPSGELDPQRPGEPSSFPAELADLEFLEGELVRYENARFGVAKDARARTFTAALRVRGRAFALLGAAERERRLADYGAVLAALARDDSAVRRIAWVERTLPGDGDALGDHLLQAKRPDATLEQPPEELVSYLQLIGRAGDVAEEHELSFAIQVDSRRPAARRAITRMGGGDLGALAVLASEVGQLVELLDRAGIGVTGILTRRGLAGAIRDAYDPWGRRSRQRQLDRSLPIDGGVAAHTAGPFARSEAWSHLATDGALHCTLWAAEWPRIDVRALFLQPLLMDSAATRTIAMCMELVGPSRAIRQAERAATETATEQSLRARVGQRTSERQVQRDRASKERERELAEGHAAVRYAAYVTVSVPSWGRDARSELESDVSRVELEAKRAPLRLERMWGQQAEAFTYGLPLCRGLR